MRLTPLTRALIGALSLAMMAACGASGANPGGTVPVPAGQLPEGVTPTVYRLSLTTDPAADQFTGAVEIDVRLDAPHRRIWLHSLDQDIVSVFARLPDGREVPGTFTGNLAEGGVSALDFDKPLPAGNATLMINYVAPYNFGLAGLYKVTQGGQDYLVTKMEAIDARRMVPSFDEPRFKTPWVVSVTAPEGLKVIANGAHISASPAGEGLELHTFSPTRPIPSYLLALAVGPYDETELQWIDYQSGLRPAHVPLRGFAAAGKGDRLADVMAITHPMLIWQEAYFAESYAYGKLDLIAAPDFAYGAMENAGAIVYRESALLIDADTPLAQRRAIYSTHAHELAHQWLGNLVTPKWWNDIWLNEAFATWMASKTMHAVDPGGAWDLNPVAGGLDAMGSDSLLSARAVRNPVTRNGDINDAFDAITYQKGGSVLSMFETYLGEDRFRDGIRVHMRRFADGVADADDFMASLAEGAGDTAVAGSFRSFIEQPGIPMLDVQVTCTDGGAEMTVSQSRYAPLGSEIDRQAASWQVPFSARTGEKGVVQKLLTGKVQTLGDLPGCPDFVMPNAGGTGYWRYSLDEDWSAKLAANYDKLTAGEQMAFVDSLIAGFHAGAVSAADLLAGLEASTGGAPMAAGLPFAALKAYHARLDADGQAALAAWIEATYAPLERWLAARREADLTDQEKLLKDSLGNLLAEYGDRPAVRAKMVANAKAKIGLGQAANAAALPAQDVGTAFGLAAAQDGADFIVPALDYAFASDDQTLRASIFRALVSHAPPQMAADMVRNAPNLPYTSSEQSTVLGGAFANVAAIDAVWPAFKASFAEITAKMPEARKQQLAAYAGSHCSAAGAADAKAFFESKAAESPGHDRRLAQGLEQAALCTARADRLIPDLTAALSAR